MNMKKITSLWSYLRVMGLSMTVFDPVSLLAGNDGKGWAGDESEKGKKPVASTQSVSGSNSTADVTQHADQPQQVDVDGALRVIARHVCYNKAGDALLSCMDKNLNVDFAPLQEYTPKVIKLTNSIVYPNDIRTDLLSHSRKLGRLLTFDDAIGVVRNVCNNKKQQNTAPAASQSVTQSSQRRENVALPSQPQSSVSNHTNVSEQSNDEISESIKRKFTPTIRFHIRNAIKHRLAAFNFINDWDENFPEELRLNLGTVNLNLEKITTILLGWQSMHPCERLSVFQAENVVVQEQQKILNKQQKTPIFQHETSKLGYGCNNTDVLAFTQMQLPMNRPTTNLRVSYQSSMPINGNFGPINYILLIPSNNHALQQPGLFSIPQIPLKAKRTRNGGSGNGSEKGKKLVASTQSVSGSNSTANVTQPVGDVVSIWIESQFNAETIKCINQRIIYEKQHLDFIDYGNNTVRSPVSIENEGRRLSQVWLNRGKIRNILSELKPENSNEKIPLEDAKNYVVNQQKKKLMANPHLRTELQKGNRSPLKGNWFRIYSNFNDKTTRDIGTVIKYNEKDFTFVDCGNQEKPKEDKYQLIRKDLIKVNLNVDKIKKILSDYHNGHPDVTIPIDLAVRTIIDTQVENLYNAEFGDTTTTNDVPQISASGTMQSSVNRTDINQQSDHVHTQQGSVMNQPPSQEELRQREVDFYERFPFMKISKQNGEFEVNASRPNQPSVEEMSALFF